MRVAVYEENDELFAQLVVAVARRRGHMAKYVQTLDEIPQQFDTDPAAILAGFDRIDEAALSAVGRLRSLYEDARIFLATEEWSSRSTMAALERGAAEVLHKPVLPRELVLRAELAEPTRAREDRIERALRVADIEVDMEQVRAVKANSELVLTRMELRLLHCLMQHFGRVAPTERLLTFGWDSEELAPSSLKTHMSHLRHKLEQAGGVPVRIKSRQRLGYALELSDSD